MIYVVIAWLVILTGIWVFQLVRKGKPRSTQRRDQEIDLVVEDIRDHGVGYLEITRIDPDKVFYRE